MKGDATELVVNGVAYVPKGTEKVKAESRDGMPYVIVRTRSAGVFAGYLKSRNGQEVTLLCARRLWYWSGAASLSQLAVEGVSNPAKCKFPCEVPSVDLTESIEIIWASKTSQESIAGVPIWKA